MPMRLLADTLSARVGRKVIDETGLSGEWDWDDRAAVSQLNHIDAE
jgi:uncharacterized protein (TIGR03435 family)